MRILKEDEKDLRIVKDFQSNYWILFLENTKKYMKVHAVYSLKEFPTENVIDQMRTSLWECHDIPGTIEEKKSWEVVTLTNEEYEVFVDMMDK